MHRYFKLILFVLLFLPLGLKAQNHQADSLKLQLDRVYGNDKVRTLLQLSRAFRYSNTPEALSYTKKARNLAENLGNDSLYAYTLWKAASLYKQLDSNAKAVKNYHLALGIYADLNDVNHKAGVLFSLGSLYFYQNDYVKSLDYFYRSLAIYKKLGEAGKISSTLFRIGMVYGKRDENGKALEYYASALEKNNGTGDYSTSSMICTQMANVYTGMNNEKQALAFFNKALGYAQKLPQGHGKHAIAIILLDIASIYQNNRSYSKAISYNKEAMALADSMDNNVLVALSYENMAKIYADKNEYATSNQYLRQSIDELERSGNLTEAMLQRIFLAKNHNALLQYEKSMPESTLALQYASKTGKPEMKKKALQQLIAAHSGKGEFSRAFTLQQQLAAINDSLYNKAKTEQIAKMRSQYEINKAESEMLQLQQAKDKKDLLLNIIIAGMVLLLVISVLVYSRQRIQIKNKKNLLDNSKLRERQMSLDIETGNRQLTTYTLSLIQKNGVLKEVLDQVSRVRHHSDNGLEKEFKSLHHLVEQQLNHENDWKDFKLYFENVHKGFLMALKQKHPNLSSKDLRFCALLKLNLNIKEMADLLVISPDSVKMARYRLRQKLGLATDENLSGYLYRFDQELSPEK